MKKFIAIVTAVMLAISTITFSGCALFSEQGLDYTTSVIGLKSESAIIKSQYQRIYDIVNTNQEKFTEEEWDQLMDIHFAFTETASRVEEIINDPKKIVTPAELRQTYELAYIGYTNAREIMVAHKEEFTGYQWSQLESFDNKAVEYDKKVRNILDNPDNEDINMTLGVIITLGGFAYKYLLPTLISMI
jgi:hypothetical protein